MKRTSAVLITLALAGCALTPPYQRPEIDTPVAFKEGVGEWIKAVPADTLERGPWWELFADPDVMALASQVEVNNQNVALAVARYAQARALVAQQRASLFPTPEEHLADCPTPQSAYGFSKLTGEVYCRAAHDEHGLPFTICRPFNAYGPGELPDAEPGIAHAVPDLIRKSLQRLGCLP